MNEYKKIIDNYLQELNEEYTSNHEPFTKILNYEFITGKLYGYYEQLDKVLTTDDFKKIYEYRSSDRSNIEKLFNFNLINKIYLKVRGLAL